MTDERIIEEMAELDGFEYDKQSDTCWYPRHGYKIEKVRIMTGSDYLEDHNAVQTIIDKMDRDMAENYVHHLILSQECCSNYEFIRMSPRQKCEAILRAYGKWED